MPWGLRLFQKVETRARAPFFRDQDRARDRDRILFNIDSVTGTVSVTIWEN